MQANTPCTQPAKQPDILIDLLRGIGMEVGMQMVEPGSPTAQRLRRDEIAEYIGIEQVAEVYGICPGAPLDVRPPITAAITGVWCIVNPVDLKLLSLPGSNVRGMQVAFHAGGTS